MLAPSEIKLSIIFRCLWMSVLGVVLGLSSACTSNRKDLVSPLQVVPHVDLKRYVGTWYEIARFPHRFQEGCAESSATYTLLEGGKVGVLNQCLKGPERKLSSAKGKAWVVDKETNAKLRVSFFWPFSGDYWIIDLGENYEYAVVGHPSRKYLWILSRTPQIDEGLYQRILDNLQKQSYDVSKLIRTVPTNPSASSP